ncbi:uncharacterized protein LOC126322554 [Schistocerca gregaria]|uniref:uncharacterized protein LOC126322554 n=1 Tax=Schistocerca gregaria TaxID=7010 RepID=UPI00211DDC8D|nr:uncharacterized protein LOC126322554 [Schistocerca gregaria]
MLLRIAIFWIFFITASGLAANEPPNELELSSKLKFARGEYSLNYVTVKSEATNGAAILDKKGVFFPIVDRISSLVISNSYSTFVESSEAGSPTYASSPNIQIMFSGHITTSKPYFVRTSDGRTYVIASFNAIITLKDGSPTGIKWVEGCASCQCSITSGSQSCSSVCLNNMCAIPEAECKKLGGCDIKVFVGWDGSDSAGARCRSSESMPFRFSRLITEDPYFVTAGTPSS